MTARTARLVTGVLALFVLLSYAPRLPELAAALEDPAVSDKAGDLLLFGAAAIGLSVVTIGVRRRLARRVRLARRADAGTGLGPRIRQAARGERAVHVPDLARRFRTSQDAIRAALGREATTPAAKSGTSFRTRQQPPRAKPAARSVVTPPRAYRALA